MEAVDPVAVHTHIPEDQTLNHSRADEPIIRRRGDNPVTKSRGAWEAWQSSSGKGENAT